jgi:hypothetical protein
LELPTDGIQWRIWIAPNYNSDESVVILKIHHVIGDGLSLLLLMGFLQSKYNHSQYLQTTKSLSKF